MTTHWNQDQLDAYLAKNKPERIQDDPDEGPEWKLQSKIESYLKEHGFYFFHDRSRGQNKAGQPDLIIALHNGRTIWVELKKAGGRWKKEQLLTRQMLLALGHEFYEIRSFKAFVGVIEQ